MIKDLKFALQCMKYAYNKKMLSILCVLFLLLSSFQFLTGHNSMSYITGGMMLLVSPSMFCQMFQTVNMSNLVVSSPKSQKMQIRILTLLNSMSILIGFLLFSIAIFILYSVGRCPVENIGYLYVVNGVMNVIILLYMAFSYKHYIAATCFFVIGFIGFYLASVSVFDDIVSKGSIFAGLGIGIAIVCIILGCIGFYGVSKIVYKSPMDKHAMQSALRAEL